jgi:hypothetical protein
MQVKFITTFSEKGYHVYGKEWIKTFVENTKNFPNITANILINNMDISTIPKQDRVNILDFNLEIPEHKHWVSFFEKNTHHKDPVKSLDIKFSYKSFVMFKNLETINEGYVIWLDADCVFLSDDFENFPQNLIKDNFIACQLECGSEHLESGIVIFNAEHPQKQKFYETMKDFYLNINKINTFGELYDGYVIRRTIDHTLVDTLDLNEGYGIVGIQSDPNCTFLNPEIKKRFLHNIGITGKRQYSEWESYKTQDKYFNMLNDMSGEPEKTLEEKLAIIAEAMVNRK